MTLWDRVLPATQRRPLDDLADHLDLAAGDRRSKGSAFWTMLILSAFIAVAGVLGDSTATVIGAMIIAPLSVPIMGIALGIVLADARLVSRSLSIVTVGVVAVIAVGFLASLLLPSTVNLLTNPQVTSRTSPNILDLIAAVATGLAGAVGLARKDVSDVLPGVAIAISLVPPLGVVGVCLGQGEIAMSLGALVLFLSNVVALVLAGTVVFTSYGYWRDRAPSRAFRKRRAYTAVGIGVVLVLVPLAANSIFTWQVAVWTERVQAAAVTWIAPYDGRVTGVSVVSSNAVVSVVLPGTLPEAAPLVESLEGQVPNGVTIVVDAGVGEQVEAGVVGAPSG